MISIIDGIRKITDIAALLYLAAGYSAAFASETRSCPVHVLSRTNSVGIIQLKNGDTRVHLADPFVEREANGRIWVYGTSNDEYLEYSSERALFAGAPPVHRKITFKHPDGARLNARETPWDTLPFSCGTKSFLFSGSHDSPARLPARHIPGRQSPPTYLCFYASQK